MLISFERAWMKAQTHRSKHTRPLEWICSLGRRLAREFPTLALRVCNRFVARGGNRGLV